MPIDIYDKDFQNWLKGVLALNTTREELCGIMMVGFKHFISKLSQPEISHLKQFLSCLNSKNREVPPLKQEKHLKPEHLKQRKKVRSTCTTTPMKYECKHGKCKTLFDKFLEQHTEKGQLDLEWDVSHGEVDTNESEPTTTVDDAIVWGLLRLYMFADNGEHATKCQKLDDLDISHVINIMRSCELFYPDGSLELYDKVTKFRNALMHSASNKVSEDNLKQNVGKAIELIKLLTNQSETEATLYLQKIGEKNFDISFQSEEYKQVLDEVKQAGKIAENLQTDERSRADLKTLQAILKRIIGSGPDDISKQFVGKASALKELVKKCIERKQKSIELDKATCSLEDDTAQKAAELEKLQQQVEEDLIEINQQLKKTDEEEVADLIDNLRKEINTLKTEKKEATRVKNDLEKENRKLREDNRNKQQEYDAELARYREEHERTKTKQDTPITPNENDNVDIYNRQEHIQKEKEKRYRANLNDSLRFYRGKVRMKPDDLLIDEVHVEWWDKYDILEEHSEYIYWLFPVMARRQNEDDEIQQPDEIKEFQKDRIAMKRLLISYKMMLNFYGLMLKNEEDGSIQRAENWKERLEHLKISTKNKLRIERIMDCLEQFGYGHLQENFMRFINEEVLLKETLPSLYKGHVNI